MSTANIFRLHLLGSAKLARIDGTQVTGRAGQRSRLALLALLSLAPRKSLNRDKVMLLLWPESSTERARNLLKVAVYVVRQALGDLALLTEGDEIRLNEGMVGSDVADFKAALENGDHERAIALYEGPLLDGFFLTDSPEFERWLDGERAGLAASFAQALDGAAVAAEQRGDLARAVELWKQLAVVDPYDSRVAVHLMRALDASGNSAAALQHAAVHARFLEDELQTAPPSELVALADTIRARKTVAASHTQSPATNVDDAEIYAPTIPARDSRRARSIGYLVGAALMGVLIFTAIRSRQSSADGSLNATPSIAVLPLVNLGSQPGDAALADGMSEELIAMLSQSRDLRVIASTSAFRFRGQQLDVQQLADSLGVSHVLEGSFQKIGTKLRVQVRLVDARDRSTPWSQTYDREYTDVFAVQNDIARSVSRSLSERLAGRRAATPQSRYTRDVVAYEYYLRGSDPALLRTDSGSRAALAYFQQAIARDSTFAAAYAGLARLYFRNASDELGLAAARKAVALDDSLSEAHSSLAAALMIDFRFAEAERALERALQLDPSNQRAREFLVHLFVFTQRPREALIQAQRALDTDPLSPTTIAELSRALMVNNRCDEALKNLERIADFRPQVGRAVEIAIQCYAQKGMFAEAIRLLNEAPNMGRRALPTRAYLLARSGQRQEALRIRDEILASGRPRAPDLVMVYTGLRDLDNAFVWLDRAIEEHSIKKEIMEPMYAELHVDPRFERVRQRMGIQNR